ncbi:hypothetical protein DPMN_067086 [Dreissena polymorpha]|uniref:Uncharacterized protein n=1 Tax=Dreissena polymorpha TaxID=45954 RepID=A0A9D4BSJ6_DREPO|nr:hypothetical protein DPMN_067086 [Dreissena polymorpha]
MRILPCKVHLKAWTGRCVYSSVAGHSCETGTSAMLPKSMYSTFTVLSGNTSRTVARYQSPPSTEA